MKRATKIIVWVFGIIFVLALLASIRVPAYVGGVPMTPETRELRDGHQIGLCLQAYAADNDGRFPASLRDLVPKYLEEGGVKVLEITGPRLDEWFYFPDAPRDYYFPVIILASPRLYDSSRVTFKVTPLLISPHLFDGNATRVVVYLSRRGAPEGHILDEGEFISRISSQLRTAPQQLQ